MRDIDREFELREFKFIHMGVHVIVTWLIQIIPSSIQFGKSTFDSAIFYLNNGDFNIDVI